MQVAALSGESMNTVIQCVPNFSEGRDLLKIEKIMEAARDASIVKVVDYSSDVDHNRMVMTLLGDPDEIAPSILASATAAVNLIDLREHIGAHPRIGAVDVIPIVPISGITMQECIDISYRIGREIAAQLNVPVYYYERSARQDSHVKLPDIRKGGFEGITGRLLDGARKPDEGPQYAHPSAGAVVIGARGPLVAYNINLASQDIGIAREIVRRIRAGADELPGLKAISVDLASRGIVQVSMNITQPDRLQVPSVFAFIENEAHRLGVEIAESEFIGILSKRSLGGATPDDLKAYGLKDTQILENWV